MDPQVADDAIGLNWLRQQAQGARVEKARDAQIDRDAEAAEALAAAREQHPYEEWTARVEEPPELGPALAEEALELAEDALQCDTEAARFLMNELLSLDAERAALVSAYLEASATKRVISSGISARWYESSGEPLGG